MTNTTINKEKVLRYLSYRNQKIDDRLDSLIDDSIEKMVGTIEGRKTYKFFQINRGEELSIEGTKLILEGNNIRKHLKDANSCILIAVSLGHKVDTLIRYYEKINMTKAIVLDACASVAIEDIANTFNKELQYIVAKDNKKLTSRYSPGYGDWPLDIQKGIVDILNTQKTIGLNVTSHNILIPRKSITAIIGVIDKGFQVGEYNCFDCDKYEDCNYCEIGG